MNIRACSLLFAFGFLLLVSPAEAQSPQKSDSIRVDTARMQWFKDAKLGVFIHWGIYAVNGISESWSFYNHYIPHDEYMQQLDGFTAENFRPEEWASLIAQSGAKYTVITSKHHDGVALWDTQQNHFSVVKDTPAGRDLLTDFAEAIRQEGLKFGLYYSLIDWSHPDYPNFTRNEKRYENDSVRWERFTQFNHAQIHEISQQFNPDLLWFDGDWEFSAAEWKASQIRADLLSRNPAVVLNNRLQGYGDYATPENGLPVYPPDEPYWELCLTMNDSWGYQPNDKAYKSSKQIIRIFADCLGMGGNLLLDIGPDATGVIPPEQVSILKDLGRWTHKHAEAIYGTHAGLPKDLYYGPSTLSADSTILYLFVDAHAGREVMLKGVRNNIHRAWVLGNGTQCEVKTHLKPYWSKQPGLVFVDLPESSLDEQLTVLALLLDGRLEISKD